MRRVPQPAAVVVAGAVIVSAIVTMVLGYRAAISADGRVADVGARQPVGDRHRAAASRAAADRVDAPSSTTDTDSRSTGE